ncbi:MAG: alpha/beta fold hydrolase [Candidatus Velthaea sp.]
MALVPQRVQTAEGVTLEYVVRGDARDARPKVALVHSLGLTRFVWESVAERLAERATVLTYDARGHGNSSKPPGPYALPAFAADLAALLDHLGWAQVNISGCSMGGCVSLQFAVLFPARVRTLGLVDTTAWYGADAQTVWDERGERARSQGLASMIDFQESRWFSDEFRSAHPEVIAPARAAFLANDVDAFAATCSMLGRFDLRESAGGLRAPCAIAVGEEDYATPPAMAQDLHERIAGSTLRLLPKARHLTPLEKSDTIAEILGEVHARAAQ